MKCEWAKVKRAAAGWQLPSRALRYSLVVTREQKEVLSESKLACEQIKGPSAVPIRQRGPLDSQASVLAGTEGPSVAGPRLDVGVLSELKLACEYSELDASRKTN
jgi:hypothetical protein